MVVRSMEINVAGQMQCARLERVSTVAKLATSLQIAAVNLVSKIFEVVGIFVVGLVDVLVHSSSLDVDV